MTRLLQLALLTTLATGCGRPGGQLPAEATVNGEKITHSQFFTSLRLAAGPGVMQRLVEQRIILQEARKHKLTVEPEECRDQLAAIEKKSSNVEVRVALTEQLMADVLLRKLILQGVSEADKRRIFEQHRAELTQYQVHALVCKSKEECARLQRRMEAGESLEEQPGATTTYVTEPEFRERLGSPEVAEMFFALQRGEVSRPLKLVHQAGFLLLKRGETRASFEELKKPVEDLLVAAGRPATIYRLMKTAQISSPYLAPSPTPVSSPTPQAFPQSSLP